MKTPKIDDRTYEQLVGQLEILANTYTTQTVPPDERLLSGRVIDQPVDVLATKGEEVDETLAWQIGQALEHDAVLVEGQTPDAPAEAIHPPLDTLTGRVLGQHVLGTENDPVFVTPPTIPSPLPGTATARAMLIQPSQVETLRQIAGLETVEVAKWHPAGTTNIQYDNTNNVYPDLTAGKTVLGAPLQVLFKKGTLIETLEMAEFIVDMLTPAPKGAILLQPRGSEPTQLDAIPDNFTGNILTSGYTFSRGPLAPKLIPAGTVISRQLARQIGEAVEGQASFVNVTTPSGALNLRPPTYGVLLGRRLDCDITAIVSLANTQVSNDGTNVPDSMARRLGRLIGNQPVPVNGQTTPVAPPLDYLSGRTLAQDIIIHAKQSLPPNQIVAGQKLVNETRILVGKGKKIDMSLSLLLSQLPNLRVVKVERTGGGVDEIDTKRLVDNMTGQVLDKFTSVLCNPGIISKAFADVLAQVSNKDILVANELAGQPPEIISLPAPNLEGRRLLVPVTLSWNKGFKLTAEVTTFLYEDDPANTVEITGGMRARVKNLATEGHTLAQDIVIPKMLAKDTTLTLALVRQLNQQLQGAVTLTVTTPNGQTQQVKPIIEGQTFSATIPLRLPAGQVIDDDIASWGIIAVDPASFSAVIHEGTRASLAKAASYWGHKITQSEADNQNPIQLPSTLSRNQVRAITVYLGSSASIVLGTSGADPSQATYPLDGLTGNTLVEDIWWDSAIISLPAGMSITTIPAGTSLTDTQIQQLNQIEADFIEVANQIDTPFLTKAVEPAQQLTTSQIQRLVQALPQQQIRVVSRWEKNQPIAATWNETSSAFTPDLTNYHLTEELLILKGASQNTPLTQPVIQQIQSLLDPNFALQVNGSETRKPASLQVGDRPEADTSNLVAYKGDTLQDTWPRLHHVFGNKGTFTVQNAEKRQVTVTAPLDLLTVDNVLQETIPLLATKGTTITPELAFKLSRLPHVDTVLVEGVAGSESISTKAYKDVLANQSLDSDLRIDIYPFDTPLTEQQLKCWLEIAPEWKNRNLLISINGTPEVCEYTEANISRLATARILIPMVATLASGTTIKPGWCQILSPFGENKSNTRIEATVINSDYKFVRLAVLESEGRKLAQDVLAPLLARKDVPLTTQQAQAIRQAPDFNNVDVRKTLTSPVRTVTPLDPQKNTVAIGNPVLIPKGAKIDAYTFFPAISVDHQDSYTAYGQSYSSSAAYTVLGFWGQTTSKERSQSIPPLKASENMRRFLKCFGCLDVEADGSITAFHDGLTGQYPTKDIAWTPGVAQADNPFQANINLTTDLLLRLHQVAGIASLFNVPAGWTLVEDVRLGESEIIFPHSSHQLSTADWTRINQLYGLRPKQIEGFTWRIAATHQVPPAEADLQGATLAEDIGLFAERGTVVSRAMANEIGQMFGDHIPVKVEEYAEPVTPPTPDNLSGKTLTETITLTAQETIIEAGTEIYQTVTADQVNRANTLHGIKPDLQVVNRWQVGQTVRLPLDSPDLTKTLLCQSITVAGSKGDLITTQLTRKLSRTLPPPTLLNIHDKAGRDYLVNIPRDRLSGRVLAQDISQRLADKDETITAELAHRLSLGIGTETQVSVKPHSSQPVTITQQDATTFVKTTPITELAPGQSLGESIPVLAAKGSVVSAQLAAQLSYLPGLTHVLVEQPGSSQPRAINVLNYDADLIGKVIAPNSSFTVQLRQPVPIDAVLNERLQRLEAGITFVVSGSPPSQPPELKVAGSKDDFTGRVLLSPLDIIFSAGEAFQEAWLPFLRRYHEPFNGFTIQDGSNTRDIGFDGYALAGKTLAQDIFPPDPLPAGTPITPQLAWQLSQSIIFSDSLSYLQIKDTPTGTTQTLLLMTNGTPMGSKPVALDVTTQPINTYDNFFGALKAARATTGDDYGQLYSRFMAEDGFKNSAFLQKFIDLWKTNGSAPVSLGDARTTTILGGGGNLGDADYFTHDSGLLAIPLKAGQTLPDKLSAPLYHLAGRYLAQNVTWTPQATIPAGTTLSESRIIAFRQNTKLEVVKIRVDNLLDRVLCDDIASTTANNNPLYPAGTQITVPQAKRINDIVGLYNVEVSVDWPANAILSYSSHNDKLIDQIAGKFLAKSIYLVAHEGDAINQLTLDTIKQNARITTFRIEPIAQRLPLSEVFLTGRVLDQNVTLQRAEAIATLDTTLPGRVLAQTTQTHMPGTPITTASTTTLKNKNLAAVAVYRNTQPCLLPAKTAATPAIAQRLSQMAGRPSDYQLLGWQYTPSVSVANNPTELIGRVLDEDINILAPAGTFITPQLANRIARTPDFTGVDIVATSQPVPAVPSALTSHTLAQDVSHTLPQALVIRTPAIARAVITACEIAGQPVPTTAGDKPARLADILGQTLSKPVNLPAQLLYPKETSLTPDQAQRVCEIAGLRTLETTTNTYNVPFPASATLVGQVLKNDLFVVAQRGDRIDEELATVISAVVNDPAGTVNIAVTSRHLQPAITALKGKTLGQAVTIIAHKGELIDSDLAQRIIAHYPDFVGPHLAIQGQKEPVPLSQLTTSDKLAEPLTDIQLKIGTKISPALRLALLNVLLAKAKVYVEGGQYIPVLARTGSSPKFQLTNKTLAQPIIALFAQLNAPISQTRQDKIAGEWADDPLSLPTQVKQTIEWQTVSQASDLKGKVLGLDVPFVIPAGTQIVSPLTRFILTHYTRLNLKDSPSGSPTITDVTHLTDIADKYLVDPVFVVAPAGTTITTDTFATLLFQNGGILNLLLRKPAQTQTLTTLAGPFPLYNDTLAEDITVGNLAEYPAGTQLKAGTKLTAQQANYLSKINGLSQISIYNSTETIAKETSLGRILAYQDAGPPIGTTITQANLGSLPASLIVYSNPILVTNSPILLTNQVLAEDIHLFLTSGTKLNDTTLNQLQHHPQLRRVRVTSPQTERLLNTPSQLVGRTLSEPLYLGRANEVITPHLAELLCHNTWPGLTTATYKQFYMVANRVDQLTGNTAGQQIPNLVQIGDMITPTLAQQISQIRSLPQVLVWDKASPTNVVNLTPANVSQLPGRVLAQDLIPFPANHTLTSADAQLIAQIADLPSLSTQRHQLIPLDQLTNQHTLAENISGLLARHWSVLDPTLAQALFIFRNALKTALLYPDVPEVLTRAQAKTASLITRRLAADIYRVYNKGYQVPSDDMVGSIAMAYAPRLLVRDGTSEQARSLVDSQVCTFPLAQTFTFTLPAGTTLTQPLQQLINETLSPHIALMDNDGLIRVLPEPSNLQNRRLINDTPLTLHQGERLTGTLATLVAGQLETNDILWVTAANPGDPPVAKRKGDSLENSVLEEDWDVLVPAGTYLTDDTLIAYLVAHTLPHFPVQSRHQQQNLERVELLPQALTGRRLWSDIRLTIPSGKQINGDALALRIGRNLPTPTASLTLSSPSVTIRPLVDPLIGQTLAQAVLAVAPPCTTVAKRGLIIDREMALTLSQVAGLEDVVVRSRPGLHAHDLGSALIRLSAHFGSTILDRLNRTPEKAYLDYLNFIGQDLLPAQPAQVPLTFQLAQGSPVDGLVPPHTQVSAPPLDASTDETVYETQEELVVTSSQLQAVVARQFVVDFHDNDQYTFDHNYYTDYTDQALGVADKPFPVFQVDAPQGEAVGEIDHTLYIACDQLQHMTGRNDVTIQIHSALAEHLSILPYSWAYWDKDNETWTTLEASRVKPQAVANNIWPIKLENMPPLKPHKVNGQLGTWLRLRIDLTLPPPQSGIALDKYTNNGNNNIGDPKPTSESFYPFGSQASENVSQFYLSGTNVFPRKGAHVTLNIKLTKAGAGVTALQGKYYKQGGNSWVDLAHYNDGTAGLSKDGTISFALPVDALWTVLDAKYTGCWLQFTHSGAFTTYPEIGSITADYSWQFAVSKIDVKLNPAGQTPTNHAIQPNFAFANGQPVDLSLPFHPLGSQPKLYDVFYLAYDPAITNGGIEAGNDLTIQVDVKQQGHNGSPTLEWQCWNGFRWETIAASDITDGTNNFTFETNQTKQIKVKLPATIGATIVNGQEAHWLRVILSSGNYGVVGHFNGGTFVDSTLKPPVLGNLVFLVTPPTFPLSACWSHNDFAYADHTAANLTDGETFIPFTPTPDFYPTMYLGFDKPFADQPISLYAQLALPDPDEVPPATFEEDHALHEPPAIVWEYATRDGGWKTLTVEDGTHGFTGRGVIRFIGPIDLGDRALFNHTGYWLRIRKDDNRPFLAPPRLHSWRLNTTWATQVQTIHNEIIGSSNGQPNQRFQLNLHPILSRAELDIREPEEMHLNDPMIKVEANGDPAGFQDEGVWIRWQAVPNFYRSTPHDRHYTLDHITGEIHFGDGLRGLVPPVAHNNIRATRYESGGGLNGNRTSHTIQELKTTLPYVDSVDNFEPATGGAERETVAEIETYGPRALRNRGRAVTGKDLEDLAHEASPDIARAQASQPAAIETFEQLEPTELWLDPTKKPDTNTLALHNDFQRGAVGLIIVPESSAVQPTPSVALLDRVRRYLSERASPTARIWVSGPDWVRVSVTAQVVPASLDSAVTLSHRVTTALEAYLHPLTGGPAGQGWPFGRVPYTSDIYSLVGDLPGVDHINDLSITLHLNGQNITYTATDDLDQLAKLSHRNLLYSGTHQVEVVSG